MSAVRLKMSTIDEITLTLEQAASIAGVAASVIQFKQNGESDLYVCVHAVAHLVRTARDQLLNL